MEEVNLTSRVTLKARMWSLLDVVLRVPPVFIMDSLLNVSLGLNGDAMHSQGTEDISEVADKNGINSTFQNKDENLFIVKHDGFWICWFILYSLGFVTTLCIFLLKTKQLLAVYLWLASFMDVIWSYICNEEYNKYVLELNERRTSIAYELLAFNTHALSQFLGNYMLQLFLAFIYCFSNSSFGFFSKRVIGLWFIAPTIISLLPLPVSVLTFTPLVVAISLWFLCIWLLHEANDVIDEIYLNILWCRNVVRHYGLYTLIENQWVRLHVPQVLRVFWLTRVIEQAVFLITDASNENAGLIALTLDNFCILAKELLIRGCETLVAVLGMTSMISSLSHYIGYVMQSFLALEDPEDRNIGTVSAILFFILALQTGLTGMEPEKRFLRLYRNLCLLFTAIFHFIHNMVNPLLLSLSASRNTSINKHGRALSVCFFLIIFPCWFLYYLWQQHTISTWLLAVSAFSIEVIIKVIISLLVYTLFMIDAYRNTFWEKLDDYVYYIRATGNSIEFIFGIFLFFNGAWILFFESGGTIRACMMCIHAYFNIWLQAKSGWKTFIKRQSAVNKINLLPEASEEQLRQFDDVCAICYQELNAGNNVRITRCRHFFHGVCLRKWLYVQDICPLCHKTLYNIEADETAKSDVEPLDEQDDLLDHEHRD